MAGVSLICSFTERVTPVISMLPLPSCSVKLVPGFSRIPGDPSRRR